MSARFLIEVPHEASMSACIHAVEVFLTTGSHFLSNADWGCQDGEHKAWMVVEADDRDQARGIVPPAFRAQAKIVQLNGFTLDDLANFRRHATP